MLGACVCMLALSCRAPEPLTPMPPPVLPRSTVAPSPTPPPFVPLPARTYHVVQHGETIWRIAQRYGVSPADLMEENNIVDPTMLPTGRRLIIPERTGSVATVRPSPRATLPRGFHTETRAIWPVRGKTITRFGQFKDGIRSTGIDIAGSLGAPVLAAKSGVVVFCSEGFEGWGKVVMIDHQDGTAAWYAYNQEILVKPGQFVRQGTLVARLGSSGRADSPLLHFKVFRGERAIDPMRFLP